MMRIEDLMDSQKIEIDDWSDWRNPSTFFELSSPENAAAISAQFSKYIANRNKLRTDVVVESYQLVPFKSKFTQDDLRYGYTNRRISVVPLVIFVSMAALILLIACFNLTNTSIAMTSRRLKEVGVRKAVGAGRRQIASQFLLETLITIILSLLVGLLMAQVIVPAFYTMWRLPYGLGGLNGGNFFISFIVLVFLAALLAGGFSLLFQLKIQGHYSLKR